MDVYVGFISPFPFDFPPQGWALCNGATMPLQQYTALYSLISTKYGGDGRSTFGLPDLRGRAIIGMGNGTGLTPRQIAQQYGAETGNGSVTLSAGNMPAHSHTLAASDTAAASLTQAPAAGWTLGAPASVNSDRTPIVTPVKMYGPSNPANPVQSAPTSVAGSGAPAPVTVPTLMPALCLSFCIALNGLFPSRN